MDEQPFIVLTDSGVYSSYGVTIYRCTEMEARQLAALRKDFARIRREKRFVVPSEHTNPYVQPEGQAGHYLSYGGHEDIRLIQRIDGKSLADDIISGEGVAHLIEQYQSYVAMALPRPRDGSVRSPGGGEG